ncbi:MAG: hypothetical protein J6O04_02485 [Selenomonadaceae bacterium]|nr:hypothetical protein [Selenomonadaceae bacterium]
MLKALIYGAGGGGESVFNEIRELNEPYEVLAFVDIRTGGTTKKGLPVVFPRDIQNYEYDIIFIATQDNTVPETLHREYGVPMEKINSKRFFYSSSGKARVRALEHFRELCDIYGIDGAVAEVGVYQGDFAKHINRLFPERKLYLYDTFEGFAQKDLQQESEGSEVATYTHYANTSMELVLSKMIYPQNVVMRGGGIS